MRRLRRARLRPREYAEVLVVLAVAIRVDRSLRHDDLRTTARLARVHLVQDEPAATPERLPPWARRRAELAQAVLRRGPVEETCLRRSLVVGHRLAPLGPALMIGVRDDDGHPRMHAWLRVAGLDLDPEAARYAPFSLADDTEGIDVDPVGSPRQWTGAA